MNTNSTLRSKKQARGEAGAEPSQVSENAERISAAARKLVEQARRLPELLQSELRENPGRALGLVGGIGFGAGVLVGSKLVRTILVTVGGYAVTELLRTYVGDQVRGLTVDPDAAN